MNSGQNDKITKDLSNKLKDAREKSGLTQAEVAEKSGMDVIGNRRPGPARTHPPSPLRTDVASAK